MYFVRQIHYFSRFSILLMVMTGTIATAQPALKKLSNDEVGNDLIEKSHQFLEDFFAKMKAAKVYDFTETGTTEIAATITPAVQKQVYEQVFQIAGEYESASLKEVYMTTDGSNFKILRYSGQFTRGTPIELRIIYNQDEKIAGYFVKPWKDQMQ